MKQHQRFAGRLAWPAAIGIAASLFGCASAYVEPSDGPYAYVRFVDNLGAPGKKIGMASDRNSSAYIFPNAGDCGHHEIVNNSGWIKIKANQEFVVEQSLASAGQTSSSCNITYAGRLKEGQRVTYQYIFGRLAFDGKQREYVCRVAAEDAAAGPMPVDTEAMHKAPKTCSYIVL